MTAAGFSLRVDDPDFVRRTHSYFLGVQCWITVIGAVTASPTVAFRR
jgi:hypothetical protein